MQKIGLPGSKKKKAGKEVPLRVENRGYAFRDNQIFLKHLIILDHKDSVLIEERPEFVRNKTGQPGLERRFKIYHLPDAVAMSIVSKDHVLILKQKEQTSWTTFYKEAPKQFPPKMQGESLPPYQLVLQKSDCLICHETEEPAVGPSFRQIAERYPKEKTAFDFLLDKIKQGGTGSWGNGMMNPHPLLADAEISPVLDYIFTLKTKGTTSQTQAPKPGTRTRPASPGFGAALSAVHPSYDLTTLHNENFKPKVGGMAFMPDGTLMVTTWDTLGGVYAIEGLKSNDRNKIKPRLIASGLAEPLGIEVVDGEIYVLQKQELTKLIDLDQDGIIDTYQAVCNTWQVIEFTQPVGSLIDLKELTIQQWWYEPSPAYGGPKKDLTDLKVSKMQISRDRKRLYLEIPGLKKRNVVYFRLPDHLKSKGGDALWSSEAWYTLNEKPL